ncbi:helix-turn-helix transcriptional regulator [Streptomyces hydrogenans]|uniref:helix-turn-helix transcriptional regulator n=1 Tax=Streptomyces hydrogenans TaxID=1873719 RepID=UPI00331E1537
MEPAHDEQTGLLTRTQIADRLGVKRPAISNWVRRYKDFPTLVSSGDMKLLQEADLARWLANRTVPQQQLRNGEQLGTNLCRSTSARAAMGNRGRNRSPRGASPCGSRGTGKL